LGFLVVSGFWEEEGRHEVPSENEMYVRLGLNIEDETENRRREDVTRGVTSNVEQIKVQMLIWETTLPTMNAKSIFRTRRVSLTIE
jgi:hypothetical protein